MTLLEGDLLGGFEEGQCNMEGWQVWEIWAWPRQVGARQTWTVALLAEYLLSLHEALGLIPTME